MAGVTIKASCPVCGDVELTPPDVRLMVGMRSGSWYRFRCATCTDVVWKEAPQNVIRLLRSVGVAEEEIPAEAGEQHHGPAFTEDDALDFMAFLDAWGGEL